MCSWTKYNSYNTANRVFVIENQEWKEYYTRLQTQYVGDEELNGRILGDVWIVGQFFWRILGK